MSERGERRSDVYIDPQADVSPRAQIGTGTRIWGLARVADDAVIGARCQFGRNTYVDRYVRVGDCVKVQNNVSIYTGVDVGYGVFLGPRCVFTNVSFPRAFIDRKQEFAATRLERGVTVGANATIVCGVTLGEFAFVGAAATVTRDVEAFALMVGTPARRIGWMCACGERLEGGRGTTMCARCGLTFEVSDRFCRPAVPATLEAWWMARMYE